MKSTDIHNHSEAGLRRSRKYPSVYILILNWNRLLEISKCLEGLAQSKYPNFQIVIIDNNSQDNSCCILEKKYPQIHFIRNDSNLGFTGGNNIGIRYALGQHADYIWLMNNDCVLENDILPGMIYRIEQNPTTGLMSPVVRYNRGNKTVYYYGTSVDLDQCKTHLIHSKDEYILTQKNKKENLCIWGTALLIRSSFLRKEGFLDEDMFAYWEDIDLSIRATRSGYENHIDLESIIQHGPKNPSGNNVSPSYYFYFTRNKFLFWRKYSSGFQKIWRLRSILISSLNSLGNSKRYEDLELTYACFDGIIAGLLGSCGKRKPLSGRTRRLFSPIIRHPFAFARIIGFKII